LRGGKEDPIASKRFVRRERRERDVSFHQKTKEGRKPHRQNSYFEILRKKRE